MGDADLVSSGNWRGDPYKITGAPDDDPFGIRGDDSVLDTRTFGDPDLCASANDGRGNETLGGSDNDEEPNGGSGVDTLTGGCGQDLFVVRANETGLRAFGDVITDLEEGETLQMLGVGPGGDFICHQAFSGGARTRGGQQPPHHRRH